MASASGFRITSTSVVATGAHLAFERFEIESPDGVAASRFVLTHPGAVASLVIDGSDAVFVRQYRSAVDRDMLEIPAGGIDPTDADLVSAVRRECIEELGLDPQTVHSLGSIFTSGGITNEEIHLFWATDCEAAVVAPDGIEEQHAEVVRIQADQLEDLVATGELVDAKSIATVTRYLLRDRD